MNQELIDLMEIVGKKEELHPALAARLNDKGSFPMITHPLVHTFYTKGFESLLNKQYTQKLAAIAELEAKGDYGTIVSIYYEKPWRLDGLMKYADRMDGHTYWKTVADVWPMMEYFYDSLDEWAEVFTAKHSGRLALMDEDEQAEFAALPDMVRVWRAGTPDGFSWTLHLDVAEWFARRFDQGNDLHERTIPKSEIIALFNGRNEHEVIWMGAYNETH